MIVVLLIISGNECGIKSGRIVFLLYLFFRRLLLNRKITMVIISGWAGVTYASECFLPGLPSLQRKSLWKRGNHQALFESYAPIINCLERKNYGATWCYDSFHSSFFLSIAFRMVSNYISARKEIFPDQVSNYPLSHTKPWVSGKRC